jgi:hypothetical protein
MRTAKAMFVLLATLLLVLSPLIAGCLTVPGPESAKKTTPAMTTMEIERPVTTVSSVTPAVTRMTAARTPMVTTVPVTIVTTLKSGYASGTCAELGGSVVSPGQQCKGSWLAATNTFSCCSIPPVAVERANQSVTVFPFDLTVSVEDSLGSITP